jgi:hypothetical protein
MNKEKDFKLTSNSNKTKFTSTIVIKCNNWCHSIRVSKIYTEEIIRSSRSYQYKRMNTVATLSSRSIIIWIWLTMCPHVPCALFKSEFVNSFTESEEILRGEVKVHLNKLVHKDKAALGVVQEPVISEERVSKAELKLSIICKFKTCHIKSHI